MEKKNQQKKTRKSPKNGTSIICAYCRGSGTDPFGIPSKLSRCQVCQGRKENIVIKPFEECPACLGTGVYKYHRLPCAVCKGKGQLHHIPGKNRKYGCRPENKEMLDVETGLPCLSAYDLGSIKKRSKK
jgi:DnaJ-class molecular chaperone